MRKRLRIAIIPLGAGSLLGSVFRLFLREGSLTGAFTGAVEGMEVFLIPAAFRRLPGEATARFAPVCANCHTSLTKWFLNELLIRHI